MPRQPEPGRPALILAAALLGLVLAVACEISLAPDEITILVEVCIIDGDTIIKGAPNDTIPCAQINTIEAP